MLEHFAEFNNIKICYETIGDKSLPAILLIMGNSAQGIMWPDAFCQKLSETGYFVIRYDHRDTGKSSCIDYEKNPYDMFDLARDALGILDTLKINKAHLIGASMGGAIAQLISIHFSDRVHSITAIMSSPDLSIKNNAFAGKDTSYSELPPPDSAFIDKIIAINSKKPETRDEEIKQLMDNWRLCQGNKTPFDEAFWYELIKRGLDRQDLNPEAKNLKFANLGNHSKAQNATKEPNLNVIKNIHVPTLIIHGTEDPIFPPEHSKMFADAVQGAKLLLLDGMGHSVIPDFYDAIIKGLLEHLRTNNLKGLKP